MKRIDFENGTVTRKIFGAALPMLVAQAVAAEERFFNRSIPAGENERILVQLRREMTNLILIGMPGSGKTTVGEALCICGSILFRILANY